MITPKSNDMKKVLFLLFACATLASAAKDRYAGGDISLLPEYEKAGAVYLDYNGGAIQGNALDYFASQGMNLIRLRLFVDPAGFPNNDPNACQSYEYILPIAKEVVAKKLPLMLDFHYSDTWADPAKQWTPASWVNLADDQLYQKIYDYTKSVLENFKKEGVVPDFIATGNEISYGMLWGAYDAPASSLKKCYMGNNANWERFGTLLKQAGKACREVCPDAKIVIHTERISQPNVQTNFYNQMKTLGVDYDIIGVSYYPYFHGNVSVLDTGLKSLQTNFSDKEVMVVEFGYPYKWAVPGSNFDFTATYPYSDAGQKKLTQAVVDVVKKYDNVTGIIWWWPEYNAYRTSLSGWYNAPLFDSTNGRACTALQALCSYGTPLGAVDQMGADLQPADEDARWFNLQGIEVAAPDGRPALPGIYLHAGRKIALP